MILQLVDRKSLRGIPLQAHQNEVLALLGHFIPLVAIERDCFGECCMVNLLYGQRLEKVATRQKQEGNTSQCPHIYFLRVAFLFLDELGSHEERRAEHKAHAMHWVELRCESKVNNLDVEVVLVVGLKEDVL